MNGLFFKLPTKYTKEAKLTERSPVGAEEATGTMPLWTDEGTILGTASYMSPEQAAGKPVDARSDIFSFGSVLYEMVTGQRAFQGDSKMSTLAAVLNQEPKPASEISRSLRMIWTRSSLAACGKSQVAVSNTWLT